MLKEAADDRARRGDPPRSPRAGPTSLPQLGAAIATEAPSAAGGADDLTPRELDVLRLIALGNTNQEIAESSACPSAPSSRHRGHIQAKTERRTRAELVAYAFGAGLLDQYRHRGNKLARH